MIWDDTGYLIFKNRYNENSLIADVFTKDHGKVTGIIFGGTSKKIKNYLQIGNKIFVNFNSKTENKIGYFKVEINQALSPLYFDDQKKLLCITSAMHIIRLLTAESQKNVNNKIQYISKSSTEKKIIPNFLIEKSEQNENLETLLNGFKLISDYLEKTILKPNNLNQPISRLEFINSLK